MNFVRPKLLSEYYSYDPVNLDFCQTFHLDKSGDNYVAIIFRMSDSNEIAWLFKDASDAEHIYNKILKRCTMQVKPKNK